MCTDVSSAGSEAAGCTAADGVEPETPPTQSDVTAVLAETQPPGTDTSDLHTCLVDDLYVYVHVEM